MQYQEGKAKFIDTWGDLGTRWGVSRTMAQVHAVLLLSPSPLCAEDIMVELAISRGNVSMRLNMLQEWDIISKLAVPGDRREFYLAEKDMWKVLKRIIQHRKQKELDPMLQALDEVSAVEGLCENSREFCKMVKEIKHFSQKAEVVLDKFVRVDDHWLANGFMKMIR